MKLLELLGIMKRRSWQELVGLRPHMIDPDSAEAGYGKRKTYDVIDRIAVIDVRGLLVNDEDWWDGWGMSTYDRIAEEVRGAAADGEVEGILLHVNSPGGETDKAFETAGAIVAAAAEKPLWAVVDTIAYSAGYLLASSASRIYVAPVSGGVGSIGVYAVHLDYSAYLEKAGVKATFIEAGKGKTDGHPYKPLSSQARERIQSEIDRLYSMFVDHVSGQRDITAGSILELGAATKAGPDAIETGLADKLGDMGPALEDMRAFLNKRNLAAMPGYAQAAEPSANFPEAGSMDSSNAPAAEGQPENVALPSPPAGESAVDPIVAARIARADTEKILCLCALSGLSAAQAKSFLVSGKTPEEVGAELLAQAADRFEQTNIVSQLQAQTSASAESADPQQSAIVKAAEKLAQAGKKEK